MQRGQAALEFIFVMLIAIIYLTTVTVPLSRDTQMAASDIEILSRANNETQKIFNAINEMALMGAGSRETVALFIPDDTIIRCTSTKMSFESTLKQKPFPSQFPDGVFKKDFPVDQSAYFLDCKTNTLTGPAKTSIIIERSTGVVSIAEGR
jgi:hypothetical protein